MSRTLLLIKENNVVWSALYETDRLILADASLYLSDVKPDVGDIYVGRVGNIVRNISSAFVDIGKTEPVFIDLKEIEGHTYENGPIFTQKTGKQREPSDLVKICQSDELVVQIVREGVKSKRAVASCRIQFAGNYLILVHAKEDVGVSLKIKDKKRKAELKELVKSLMSEGNYGFVVRTNAESASNRDILDEGAFLLKRYREIILHSKSSPAKTRLYSEPAAYLSALRDLSRYGIEKILIEDETLYEETESYLREFLPSFSDRLLYYSDDMISLGSLYGFHGKLEQALKSRVWLKSGAYLVIEPTEAMTVIDVNTGKAIRGKKSKEETIFKTNMEAAKEIAFQIRLRNLSGIIIIDFIDMADKEHRKLLLEQLRKLFLEDLVHTCLVDMTALNLVEVTRKKIHRPLHEVVKELKVHADLKI